MRRKPDGRGDELRRDYTIEYSKAVRGGYFRRLLKEGANVVVLEPDAAKAFRDSAAVNDVLRSFLAVARASRRSASRSGRSVRKRSAA